MSTGKHSARKVIHARILLKADESTGGPCWIDEQMSEAMEGSLSTRGRVRQQCIEEGGEAAISRRKGSGIRDRKVDGECEAHVVALTWSTPPEGHVR
jgi:hypothetical protein